MRPNKIEQFNTVGKELFHRLCDEFGYTLEEIKIFELKEGQPWSIKHIYVNIQKKLKIEIEQAPYYTDYGFSFTIYNLESDEYNIIYNVPHEKQDDEGKFLQYAAINIFGSERICNIIKGEVWEKLGYIYFQR